MRLGVQACLVDGLLQLGDVEIADGVVVATGLEGGGRGIALPGFVDLQVNGFAGIDFLGADAEGYREAADALLETGVTAFLPTFITSSEDDLVAALRSLPREGQARGPRVLGAHLEGPFLSAARLGTHPARYRSDPDLALLERLLAAGPVRAMTLAPELPGALELVDVLQARGIVVSLGHSNATAAEAHAAFDRGVRTVTHVFNAMRPLTHRDPGIVGAALVRPDVVVQAIVDGVHLDRDVVRLLWNVAAGRFALVTDAIAAAGLGDGPYALGSVDLTVSDGIARRSDGVLAGSTLTMIQAVRNLVALGVSLERAAEAASLVPAGVLGTGGIGTAGIGTAGIGTAEIGRLTPGNRADVVVLDDNLEIERVLVGGETRVAG